MTFVENQLKSKQLTVFSNIITSVTRYESNKLNKAQFIVAPNPEIASLINMHAWDSELDILFE